jgi:CheY-like chemotaxis protein
MTDGVALKSVQGKVRILRIAADIALAPVIASLLIRRGYDMKSFTNSQEALLELQQHPESDNIILHEHNIPQMTGLELAREVRALQRDIRAFPRSGYIDETLLVSKRSAGRAKSHKEADFDALATLMSQLTSS